MARCPRCGRKQDLTLLRLSWISARVVLYSILFFWCFLFMKGYVRGRAIYDRAAAEARVYERVKLREFAKASERAKEIACRPDFKLPEARPADPGILLEEATRDGRSF